MFVYSFSSSSQLRVLLYVLGCVPIMPIMPVMPVFSVYASENHHNHTSWHVRKHVHAHTHMKQLHVKQLGKKKHLRHHVVVAATGVALTAVAAPAASALATPTQVSAAPAVNLPPTTAVDHTEEVTKGTVTGLPLPRYAALRADEVNMRVGPGERFPILWVYHRRGLPVRIEREFDTWRLVEDASGQKGWVQKAILVNDRDFLVPGDKTALSDQTSSDGKKLNLSGHTKSREVGYVLNQSEARAMRGVVLMYESAQNTAPIVALLQPGTVGSIKKCKADSSWCEVSVRQYTGWVMRKDIWGVDRGESVG